jgi:decaprenyl-phosphate phosphoribosyltransferase
MEGVASAARDLVRLVRPRDWLKNVFVLFPLPFALGSGNSLEPLGLGLGLIAMSLTSSAAYVFNDWWDAERDRRHPRKRVRPLAAGRLPAAAGPVVSLGLAVAGMTVAFRGAPAPAGILVASYLGLQVFYTLYGKHVPLIDVFLLTSGFVLRVVLGCALAGVTPSNWLLLCSSSLALLLALAKRRADLLQGLDERHRPSLAGYTRSFLDQGLAVSAGLTITAYALYCMDAAVLLPGREFVSLPFVVFGVMECLRIVHAEDGGGSPVDMLLSSPVLLACSCAWAAAILLSIRVSVAV